jgi:7,8-dihydroneopterin aldolase/epimerase/oxygenase
MNGRIHLKNMVFYGYHGNLAEENALGQRFMIDLVMTLDITEAAQTDSLHATVDYVKVYGICRQILEHDRVKLLETLANHLLDRILEACPRVTKAEIIIKKPSAPMGGVLDYVALETSKEREHRVSRTG